MAVGCPPFIRTAANEEIFIYLHICVSSEKLYLYVIVERLKYFM
jgi:hypothetical protein